MGGYLDMLNVLEEAGHDVGDARAMYEADRARAAARKWPKPKQSKTFVSEETFVRVLGRLHKGEIVPLERRVRDQEQRIKELEGRVSEFRYVGAWRGRQ